MKNSLQLLSEAARAVGDPELISRLDRQAVEMTDIALKEGLTKTIAKLILGR